MGIWKNDDGLVLKYGASEAKRALVGETDFDGPEGFLNIDLNYTDLPAYNATSGNIEGGYATGGFILSEGVRVPEGIHVKSVEIITDSAWDSSGDNMTLTIGLIKASDRTTEKDFNGFVDAATQTELNAATGATPADSVNDTGWVGALVGTKLDSTTTAGPWLLTAQVGTSTATAGHAQIRIHWYVPMKSNDTLGDVL